jgi:hypothetical protein
VIKTLFEDAYAFPPSPLSSPIKGEETVVDENFSIHGESIQDESITYMKISKS